MNTQRRFLRALLPALFLSLAACGEGDRADKGATEDYVENMAAEHADDVATPRGATELGGSLGEVPAMPILSETVEYGRVNGKPVSGYFAYPESAHGGLPGVLVFHEWWGLNDNIRAMADKLASQGYVVLALDVYGGEVATTPERARELMQQAMADQAAIDSNTRQAWKFMTEEIGALSVASLGWCLGGTLAFNAALLYPEQLAGTVVYYGFVTGATRDQLAMLDMPVLGFFGAKDGGIPVEGVRQFSRTLEDLNKDAEIVIYDNASHAFANPTGDSFEAEAAEDAWQRTLVFLDRTLNAAVNRNVLEEQPAPAGESDSANAR